MGLLDLIERAINEHGSAAIMRERLDLIRDQAQALEKKMADLQDENTRLKKRIAELEADLAAKTKRNEFVEHRGALFKRKPTGAYHNAVFCPDCEGPMMSLEGELPFHCGPCKRSVSFSGRELPEIMGELP
jgi:hypothetical protein